MKGRDQDCLLPVEEAGVIWDGICFFFLLLQRRVFLSYYFLHVSVDLQATALQASRSAPAQPAHPGAGKGHPGHLRSTAHGPPGGKPRNTDPTGPCVP